MPVTNLALLDNDVVLKACTYKCQHEVTSLATLDGNPPLLLTVASYAIRSRLQRSKSINDKSGALAAFEEMQVHLTQVDPTDAELMIAAELEEIASSQGLELDVGESQLVAILLERQLSLILTGDKRAIAAIAKLKAGEVGQRVVCLEQLVISLLAVIPHDELRKRICAEPTADKAITNCFGCGVPHLTHHDIVAGLSSYHSHLTKLAGAVLAPVDVLHR